MMFADIRDRETRQEVESNFNTMSIGAIQEVFEVYGGTVVLNDGRVSGVGEE